MRSSLSLASRPIAALRAEPRPAAEHRYTQKEAEIVPPPVVGHRIDGDLRIAQPAAPSVVKICPDYASIRPAVRWLGEPPDRRLLMTDANAIREHMEVIGADGVHDGAVDHVDG